MTGGGGLTIRRMVELGRVSRSSLYRFDPQHKPGADRDMELRDAIQRIALEWPCYGRPRITEELRRQGWTVNPKRVYRLMREDNLLCVRRRKFLVTTDSNHGRRIYPNLAHELALTGVNQLYPTSGCWRSSCFWRRFWMPSRGESSAGRWIAHSMMN